MRAVYGVDLEAAGPVVVRAERRGRRLLCARVSVTDPRLLRDLAAGATVAGCLSQRESFTRWLDTPYAGSAKAVRVLPALLDVDLPFAIEDCAYSFLDLHKGGSGLVRAMAVGARTDAVSRKLEALKSAGFDPQVLDAEAVALWSGALREMPQAGSGLQVVVHATGDRWGVLAGRDRRLLCANNVRVGDTGHVHRILCAAAGSDGASAAWFLTGSAAGDSLCTGMREALGKAWPGSWNVAETPELFLARSLACRAAAGEGAQCNLRSGALAHPGAASRSLRALRLTSVTALAAGLALIAANLAVRVELTRGKANLRSRFRADATTVAGYDIGEAQGEHALRLVREAVARREASMAPFVTAVEDSTLDRVASLVRTAAAGKMKLRSLTLGAGEVDVSGLAPEWKSAEALMDVLGRGGASAALDRKDAGADGWIPFTIGVAKPHE